MKETEIVRGLDKARAKRAMAVRKYADGVAQAQPLPDPMSLRGLGRAVGQGAATIGLGAQQVYNNAVGGMTNLFERTLGGVKQMPGMTPPTAPMPSTAPTAPVAPPMPTTTSPAGPGYSGTPLEQVPGVDGLRRWITGGNRPGAQIEGFSRGAAQLDGPGTATSDDIPAMLSRGEAVLPAKTVQAVGPKNIARLIESTNGKPPVDGARHGLRAASGMVPGLEVTEFGDATPSPSDIRAAQRASNVAAELPADGYKLPTAQAPAPAAAPAQPAGRVAAVRQRVGDFVAGRPAAPAAPAVPKPSLLDADVGQLARSGLGKARSVVNGGVGRAGGILAAGTAALDTANTDTEDYRKRFGLETDDPSFAGDLGVRVLGYFSDLGNALTFGQASRLYRDKQAPEAAPAGAAPAAQPTSTAPAPAAPAAPGAAPGTGLRAGTITRDGTSYSGRDVGPDAQMVDAGGNPVEARGSVNPGLGGSDESRMRDARALAMYQDINRQAQAEGDAARASASAVNEASQRSFDRDKAEREANATLSQARFAAGHGPWGRKESERLQGIAAQQFLDAQQPEKNDLERSKVNVGLQDARARMLQSWMQHQDNRADRQAQMLLNHEDRQDRLAETKANRELQNRKFGTEQQQEANKGLDEDLRGLPMVMGTDEKGKPYVDDSKVAGVKAFINANSNWNDMAALKNANPGAYRQRLSDMATQYALGDVANRYAKDKWFGQEAGWRSPKVEDIRDYEFGDTIDRGAGLGVGRKLLPGRMGRAVILDVGNGRKQAVPLSELLNSEHGAQIRDYLARLEGGKFARQLDFNK